MHTQLSDYVAGESFVYFTITNAGYVNFVLNFCKRLEQLNMMHTFIIICTDKESYNLLNNNIQQKCIYFPCIIPKTFESWRTTNYKKIVFNKLTITKQLLEWALKNNVERVVYFDTDIWCFKNFINDLIDFTKPLSGVDVIMQDGDNYEEVPVEASYSFNNEGHLNVHTYCTRLCTGVMVIKPTNKTIELFDHENNKDIDWKTYVGNQPYINDAINILNIPAVTLPRKLAVNGSIFGGVDTHLDTNTVLGKVESVQNEAWLLHYTYTLGLHKIEKMIQANHWLLPSKETQAILDPKNGKPNIYVRCPDGFINQLRIILAGSYLVKANYINSFTCEWVLNNHNNVDFKEYFEPLPGVTMQNIPSDIKDEDVIKTCSFEFLITKYSKKGVSWKDALNSVLKYLIVKPHITQELQAYIAEHDIANTTGLHIRRTCKSAMLNDIKNRSKPLTNDEFLILGKQYLKIFVATDNKETQDLFIKEHPVATVYKPITGGNEKFPLSTYDCQYVERFTDGHHCVMDFLILKHCRVFIGSHESSFSLLLFYWRCSEEDYFVFGKF